MSRTIRLKYASRCADCGTHLPAGTRARWYRRGVVYGLTCHDKTTPGDAARTAYESGDRTPGAIASHYDRRGVYSGDGRLLGTTGPRCEDAPCCGCCS